MNTALKHKYIPLRNEEDYQCRDSIGWKTKIQNNRYLPLLKWFLLLLMNLVAFLFVWQHSHRASQSCGLPSDVLFGNIPWQETVLENDERYIVAQPLPESVNQSEPSPPSIWDSLWPGTWVAFDDPSTGGAKGRGMRMKEVGAHPDVWSETSEGFGIAVMHQLHCVMAAKQVIMDLVEGRDTSRHLEAHTHLYHCMEILRQAVMCHGDMTIEHPVEHDGRQGVTGWGNVHMCRDWDKVHEAVLGKRITRSQHGGWLDTSKKQI